jgi:hypothetical protein
MDNRIKSSLAGKPLLINWRSLKKIEQLQNMSDALVDLLSEPKKEDETIVEKLERDRQALVKNYKEAAEIMFEFTDGEPDWEDEDFPQGEMEYNQVLFMKPTVRI